VVNNVINVKVISDTSFCFHYLNFIIIIYNFISIITKFFLSFSNLIFKSMLFSF